MARAGESRQHPRGRMCVQQRAAQNVQHRDIEAASVRACVADPCGKDVFCRQSFLNSDFDISRSVTLSLSPTDLPPGTSNSGRTRCYFSLCDYRKVLNFFTQHVQQCFRGDERAAWPRNAIFFFAFSAAAAAVLAMMTCPRHDENGLVLIRPNTAAATVDSACHVSSHGEERLPGI